VVVVEVVTAMRCRRLPAIVVECLGKVFAGLRSKLRSWPESCGAQLAGAARVPAGLCLGRVTRRRGQPTNPHHGCYFRTPNPTTWCSGTAQHQSGAHVGALNDARNIVVGSPSHIPSALWHCSMAVAGHLCSAPASPGAEPPPFTRVLSFVGGVRRARPGHLGGAIAK
jgi:hypothetical protein